MTRPYTELEDVRKQLDGLEKLLNSPLTKTLNFITGALVILLLALTIYTAVVGNIGGAVVLGSLFLFTHLARFTIAFFLGLIVGGMKEIARK